MRAPCSSGNATRATPPPPPGWRTKTKTWEEMSHWERLVHVLERDGPQTTGALGHIKGIGENVRGIRIEANRGLARYGMFVESEKTEALDADGKQIPNATYRLVNLRLKPHLERTERVLAGMQGRLL